MKHTNISGKFFAAMTASLILAGAHTQTWAENATEDKPLELRKVMQELGKDMQLITGGISREDWALVAKTAPRIATHPQPPATEKMRIMAFMGADMGKFKGHDGKTHQAAHDLEHAAMQNDGNGVITAFATLQSSCLACHQAFRKPFVEHFYGKR